MHDHFPLIKRDWTKIFFNLGGITFGIISLLQFLNEFQWKRSSSDLESNIFCVRLITGIAGIYNLMNLRS